MLYKEESKFWNKFKQSKIFSYIIIFLIIFIALFGTKILFSSENITIIGNNIVNGLFNTEDKTLKGENDNRINFLLIGIGGKGHDGANLSDTIILISLQLDPLKVATISIPRDLLVFVNGYGYRKINSIHALAEAKKKDSGPEVLAQTIAQTFNIPIHYYLRIDFQGFKDFIDQIGGVDIYVERSFTDYLYPTEDHKYQTVHFDKGWTTMDGDTLLKYSRSRHGDNGESGDFARAHRQQIALIALKKKLLSSKTWLNPKNIYSLLESYEQHFYTNLKTWEILKLINILKNLKDEDIIKFTFTDDYNNYLQASSYHGAYVLIPKSGDFSEMQNLIQNIFNQSIVEKANIAILNGTNVSGLASKTKNLLNEKKLHVNYIDNADNFNYEHTIIYNLSGENKLNTLNKLKEIFPNAIIKNKLDNPNLDSTGDFLIILGKDYAEQYMNNNTNNIYDENSEE